MANEANTKKESYELPFKVRQQVLERQNYICPICGTPIIGRYVIHHIINRKFFSDNDPHRDDPSNLEARHELCEYYAHTVGRTGNPKFSRIWNGFRLSDEDMDESREIRYPYGCLDAKRKDRLRTRVKHLSKGRYHNGYKDSESLDYSRKGIVTNQKLVKNITAIPYFVESRTLQMQG